MTASCVKNKGQGFQKEERAGANFSSVKGFGVFAEHKEAH